MEDTGQEESLNFLPLETPQIYTLAEMEVPEFFHFGNAKVAAYSCRSPVGERENQDAAAVVAVEDSLLLAVADGVGGQKAGAKASEFLVRELEVLAKGKAESLRAPILNAIESANDGVNAMGIGAASTLALVELSEGGVRSFHVGDSFTMVVGRKGKLKFLTVDHSPVGYAVEAGVMTQAEAIHHVERNIVSNVVGSNEMRIDIGPVLPLAPGDSVLIASDGVSDNLHRDEIVEIIRKGSLDSAALLLLEACRKRMTAPEKGEPSKPDDLTFILYRPE